MRAGLEFAREVYAPRRVVLAVAAFNVRAIRVYQSVGFTETGRHVRTFERYGAEDFVDMESTWRSEPGRRGRSADTGSAGGTRLTAKAGYVRWSPERLPAVMSTCSRAPSLAPRDRTAPRKASPPRMSRWRTIRVATLRSTRQ
ncbi:GNAT family N-acetyltransferase [Parafrankia sp. FMc2]|uniref:GNAT family N-acetyltransferase n=1 Tax=Parafrankia sp. FMc2 TaxID=3233196 RepID=UPI0034D7061C